MDPVRLFLCMPLFSFVTADFGLCQQFTSGEEISAREHGTLLVSAFTYLPKRLLGGRSSEMRGAASLLDILAATSSSSIRTEVSALSKC